MEIGNCQHSGGICASGKDHPDEEHTERRRCGPGPQRTLVLRSEREGMSQQIGWKGFPRRDSGVLRKTKPVFLNISLAFESKLCHLSSLYPLGKLFSFSKFKITFEFGRALHIFKRLKTSPF